MYSILMMIWEGIDKRKFPRARYECRILISSQGKDESFETLTENIGSGGICVVLGKEFDLFKTAQIEMHIPEKKRVVRCSGTIVWVIRKRISGKGHDFNYDIGIEFIEISDDDKDFIAALVDELIES
ncbi:MAG: PilZ domain-containing protein [Candidatus Omnitrophica bacterium]|nr:PilZ domain-containing protein [Candidatus Omnitrophota bacterium]